jgi:predicted transcriptional regulator
MDTPAPHKNGPARRPVRPIARRGSQDRFLETALLGPFRGRLASYAIRARAALLPSLSGISPQLRTPRRKDWLFARTAVPIRRSITPDFLICLDDGKRFKSLRRHLSGLGLTPEQYREKWNLPYDYPWLHRITRHSGQRWRSRSDLARLGGKLVSAKASEDQRRTKPNLPSYEMWCPKCG